MSPESSSVKAVNLVKNVTITEIINFSEGIVFLLAHPVDAHRRLDCTRTEISTRATALEYLEDQQRQISTNGSRWTCSWTT